MKKVVKMLMRGSLVVIFAATMFTLSFAEDIRKAPAGTVALPSQADLAVTGIYATDCKCDLPEFDMFFMGEIAVEVSKKDISTPAAARTEPSVVVGTLVVTYHNPVTRRDERQVVMLQNSHFSTATGTGYIKVIHRPVLVKKSVGVKAEITLNSPGYATTDPNTGNNVMTKKTCEVMLR